MICAMYLMVDRRSFTTYEDLVLHPEKVFDALFDAGVPFHEFVQIGNVTNSDLPVSVLPLREEVYKTFADSEKTEEDVMQLAEGLVECGAVVSEEDAQKEATCMRDAWLWAPRQLEKHRALLTWLGYWGITWFVKETIVAVYWCYFGSQLVFLNSESLFIGNCKTFMSNIVKGTWMHLVW